MDNTLEASLKKTSITSFLDKLAGYESAQKPTNRLAAISAKNVKIVKQLLQTAKKANESGNKVIAKEVMESIEALLNNNQDLQEVVIEIKPKLD